MKYLTLAIAVLALFFSVVLYVNLDETAKTLSYVQGQLDKMRTVASEPTTADNMVLKAKDGGTLTLSGNGLVLEDYKGRIRLLLVGGMGNPSISIWDENDKMRTQIGVSQLKTISSGDKTTTSEANLVLFKPDGTVLTRLPE